MAKRTIKIRTRPIKLDIKWTAKITCFCGCTFERIIRKGVNHVTCPQCGREWS